MNNNGKKLLKGLGAAGLCAGLIYGINKLIFTYSTMKELLSSDKQAYFNWRFGNIYYSKTGTGSPVLLIHDLNSASSGYEWKEMIQYLAKDHTVYVIDLPGCGRSDKQRMIYTNYLFVQAIDDFVRKVIKEKTDIITSGVSSSLAIMACHGEPELYGRFIFINPESLDHMIETPRNIHKLMKHLIELPLIGTLFYNVILGKQYLSEKFKNEYFFDRMNVSASTLDAFYESAHLGGFGARYCLASQAGMYTRVNIVPALKKIDHSMYIICGEANPESQAIFDGYTHFNAAIETITMEKTKGMPHMENPKGVASLCELFLNEQK